MTPRCNSYLVVIVATSCLAMSFAFASAADVAVSADKTNAVSASTSPVLLELSAAATALKELKQMGALPGVTTDARIDISTGQLPASMLGKLEYPIEVTLLVNAEAEFFTNHYAMTRADQNAGWQMDKAWRTDAQGRTVKTWSVDRE